jgi:glycosyltransferase involved in cell wall biosynthesis
MPQPEVSAHFAASDICVLPYRDGVSFRRGTFMAALAHGKAIVTTKNDEGRRTKDGRRKTDDERQRTHGVLLPELRDGENVVLVPPEDAGAIVNAVNRVAASPELRAKLERGALQAAQFFTWDAIADAHLALYRDLLS